MVDTTKYVVLDVETNGLSSLKDDLLSVSIYMPCCDKRYERFLPLELPSAFDPFFYIDKRQVYLYLKNSVEQIKEKFIDGGNANPYTIREYEERKKQLERLVNAYPVVVDKINPKKLFPLVVKTTEINGITYEMVKNQKAYTQAEIDSLIEEFELDKRIILHYGSIDEKFLRNYFKRNKLPGFERLTFHNIKNDIISSGFGGNVTKDNLCHVFGIKGITDIHTGINDCILQWQLFLKIQEQGKLIVLGDDVFTFSEDYILPISYISSMPKLQSIASDKLPNIKAQGKTVFEHDIFGSWVKKFETNISGITIEHLLYNLLSVEQQNNSKFLAENRRHLKKLGKLPSPFDDIPIVRKSDGTITTTSQSDSHKKYVDEVNFVTEQLRNELPPIVKFMQSKIFNNETILGQELIVDNDRRVLALCDLSNAHGVLEIKTGTNFNLSKIKWQLYFQSNNRKVYTMHIDWAGVTARKKYIKFVVSEIDFVEQVKVEKIPKAPRIKIEKLLPKTEQEKIEHALKKCQDKVLTMTASILVNEYIRGTYGKAIFQCKNCNHSWEQRTDHFYRRPRCPAC